MKRKSNKASKEPTDIKVDLSQYNIVEMSFPFPTHLAYRQYIGRLENNIAQYEQNYGKIDGKILVSGSITGIISSQNKLYRE